MMALKTIYIANVIVAGWIGIVSIFFPKLSAATVFSNAYESTEVIRLAGSLWLAIALLSVLGLIDPIAFSAVLLLQLMYKGTWLLAVALPAIRNNQPYPAAMALFFLVWVIILPFFIPWSALFNRFLTA